MVRSHVIWQVPASTEQEQASTCRCPSLTHQNKWTSLPPALTLASLPRQSYPTACRPYSAVLTGNCTPGSPALVDGHDNLLKRCIPSSLADPIDCALHLSCTRHGTRQAVGRCKPQIILTVRRKDDIFCSRRVGSQAGYQGAKLVRQVPASCVGNVESGCTRLQSSKRLQKAIEGC